MNDKKNIDRLFQEKFKDFEATPSDSVWENISKTIAPAKKQRRIIPIWWKIGGVAAGLLLLFALGNLLNTPNDISPEQKTVNTDSKTSTQDYLSEEKTIDRNEKVIKENSKKERNTINSNSILTNSTKQNTPNFNKKTKSLSHVAVTTKSDSNKNNIIASSTKTIKKNASDAVAQNTSDPLLLKNQSKESDIDKEGINSTLNALNQNPIKNTDVVNSLSKEKTTTDKKDGISLTDAIATTNNDDIPINKEEKTDRWRVAPSIAPVYFNTMGTGSSLHEQFNNNSKTGDINMSYGISASYAITSNLRIKTGIHKVTLGYSTNDVIVYNNLQSSSNNYLLRNVRLNKEAVELSFISAEDFSFSQVPSIVSNSINASIDQKLGFVEIPIELQYIISKNKLGVHLIGGFSALFLSDNQIYAIQNGESTLIGKATNINNMSYSANLGIGLDYNISKKINLNLEPVFKYQLNTFNNTSGNFKPYFIGVYTGLSFKF